MSAAAPAQPIIVAGAVYVAASERDSYLRSCHDDPDARVVQYEVASSTRL